MDEVKIVTEEKLAPDRIYRMLVFIDESGDPGMQGKTGSSEYFIVTAVVFEDLEDANGCDARVDQLRAECFRAGRGEFHFNSCCREIRERFLTETGKFEYVYLSFAFNKSKLYGRVSVQKLVL